MKGISVGTSTHPTHPFIDNHKNTIPIADFPDTLNIPLRRRDTSQCRSNNRLKNKSYYFLWTNFLNHIHQLSYQGFRVLLLSPKLITICVAGRDFMKMLMIEDWFKQSSTESMTANNKSTKGSPMITLSSRNKVTSWGIISLFLDKIL